MIVKILISVAIGALVGWLAGKIMNSRHGLIGNIIIGVIGGALGSWLAGLIGIPGAGSWIVSILIGIAGTCLLIFLFRLIFGKR